MLHFQIPGFHHAWFLLPERPQNETRMNVLLFPWVTLWLTKSPPSGTRTGVGLTRRSDRYHLMSSCPSSSAVVLRTMSSGRITRPGDMVEKIEKN